MKLKIKIVTLVFLLAGGACATTPDDAYRITSYLVDRYTTADDWCDMIDGTEGVELQIGFQTADSLFRASFPSNHIGRCLTPQGVRDAFDQFLMAIAHTNRTEVDGVYESTAAYALVFCAERCYTNAICAATSILCNASSPCQYEAYSVLRAVAVPSMPMNQLVFSVVTNHNRFSLFDRNALYDVYAQRLSQLGGCDEMILTNGISMLRIASSSVRSKISLDELLLKIPLYSVSANRFAYAMVVLGMSNVAPKENEYFSAVTNSLMLMPGPLRSVVLP